MSLTIALFNITPHDRDYFQTHFDQDYHPIFIESSLDEQTVKQAAAAEVLSVRVTSRVTADLMKQLPKLRHIATRTTGFDHIDTNYAAAHDITISTVPAYGENTIAEFYQERGFTVSTLTPVEFPLQHALLADLLGGDKIVNAKIIRDIFSGATQFSLFANVHFQF